MNKIVLTIFCWYLIASLNVLILFSAVIKAIWQKVNLDQAAYMEFIRATNAQVVVQQKLIKSI